MDERDQKDVQAASELIKRVLPRDHRSVGDWLSATAIKLRWSRNRVHSIWYGEARRIAAWEMDILRDSTAARLVDKSAVAELTKRLDRLEEAVLARIRQSQSP